MDVEGSQHTLDLSIRGHRNSIDVLSTGVRVICFLHELRRRQQHVNILRTCSLHTSASTLPNGQMRARSLGSRSLRLAQPADVDAES